MLKSSPMKCQNFLQQHCLSCDLLAYDYLSSIKIKQDKLASLFSNHTRIIKPTIICEETAQGSRNKAKLAVALVNNAIEFGFYTNKMQFKKLEDCPLHAPPINAVLIILKKLLLANKIIPYDLFSKKGELKYLLITYSASAHELLLRFVLRSKESLADIKKITEELLVLNPIIKVVSVNIQSIHQAILEGDEEIVLTKNDCIAHHFDEYTLFQGPRSFFQTNSAQALKLYQQFQQEFSTLKISSFLDLYCGVGAFAFFAKKYCHNVTGIEISDAAIFYANKARAINGHKDINFIAMDAADFLTQQQTSAFAAIMVNPPRRGLNNLIITELIRLAPTYLFYSSCNANTLQRDLLQLENKYQIQSLQIFDLFPHTSHFETLAILKLK
jgi:23S rRNA (uracil747-C5)-methyltransferase